jgi:hypothetical protein
MKKKEAGAKKDESSAPDIEAAAKTPGDSTPNGT